MRNSLHKETDAQRVGLQPPCMTVSVLHVRFHCYYLSITAVL